MKQDQHDFFQDEQESNLTENPAGIEHRENPVENLIHPVLIAIHQYRLF
ncbi:MAG: hypothetical protein JNK38_13690 [Acidobacteria bacterium]|nr:hypothetical protein [Acidobacteriota bacterium]